MNAGMKYPVYLSQSKIHKM